MNDKLEYCVGCDIGGSHITCAVIELESGNMLQDSLINFKISHTESKGNILNAWSQTIQNARKSVPQNGTFKGVGIAIPGPFDYTNGIGLYDTSNNKFLDLNSVNVKNELAMRLALQPDQVRFVNDATAFSLGSYWYGKGIDSTKLVGITLGTGFGSSFIDDGKAVEDGPSVPENGYLWDKPFEDGIFDDYFSTRWLVNTFNEEADVEVTGVREIAELARNGNEIALKLFEAFGVNLARGLAEHLIKFNADTVVLGGNIAKAFEYFKEPLIQELRNRNITTQFKLSSLQESASMLGAASLLKD